MVPPYRKIAKGVLDLKEEIGYLIMPVGIDGPAVLHLLDYCWQKEGVHHTDCLDFAVQISSKSGELDYEKFKKIALKSQQLGVPLYALDMRTKTGSLGRILKDETAKIENAENCNIELKYAVVFDPDGKADIRGSSEELSDEERPLWVNGEKRVKELIHKKEGIWQYNLTHKAISEFNHIPEIKKEIDLLI